MSTTALIWELIARDNASPAFRKAGASAETAATQAELASKNLNSAGKKLNGVTQGLGGVAVLFGGYEMIKAATKFQSEMLLIQTQAGASADEVKRMSTAVLGLSGQVATAPEELATSLYHVESVGLRGAKALDVVRVAAEGAKVGHADLEATTNALTASVASGIPGIENMAQAMGVLNGIVGSGDMKMQDLNEALGSGLLTVVKGYGLSITDVGAALATFGDNNIRGADAATMLRMAVQAMAVPAKTGRKELAALGLTADTLAHDMQTGGLNKALLDLQQHLKDSGVQGNQMGQVLTEVFGKKAGPGLAVLEGQMARFETKLVDVKKSGNSFGADWQAWLKSNQGQMDQLTSHVQTLEVEYGNKLLPVLNDGISFLNHNSTAVLSVVGAILGLKAAIGAVNLVQDAWKAGTAATVGVQKLLGIQTAATTAEVEASAAAQESATVSSRGLAGAAGKMGAAGGILTLAVAAGVGGKALSDYIEQGRSGVSVLNGFAKANTDLQTSLVNGAGSAQDIGLQWAKAQVEATGLSAKAAAAGITTDELTHAIMGGAGATSNLISVWKASGKPASDTLFALITLAAQYQHVTANVAANKDKIDALNNSLTHTPKNVAIKITLNDQASAGIAGLLYNLNSIQNTAFIAHVNAQTGGSRGAKQASGGILGHGWTLVGEQGPEMVYNNGSGGGKVFSNSDTRRNFGQSAPSISLTVNAGLGTDGRAVGRQIVSVLEQHFGSGGRGNFKGVTV